MAGVILLWWPLFARVVLMFAQIQRVKALIGGVGVGAVLASACGLTSTSSVTNSISSTIVSTTTTLPKVKLTNFGASLPNWNSSHTPDPNNSSGYWPRLPDGRDTYSSLKVQNGVVLGFTFALYPSIPSNLATVLVRDFMPPTEVVISTIRGNACKVYNFAKFSGHNPYAALIYDVQGSVKSIIFGVDTLPSGC